MKYDHYESKTDKWAVMFWITLLITMFISIASESVISDLNDKVTRLIERQDALNNKFDIEANFDGDPIRHSVDDAMMCGAVRVFSGR